jgi:ATP-binding protein involved in chromosome partitioning
MSVTKEQIIDALRHVNDPDLNKDLVTLNMVENIVVENNSVSFTIVLTTPSCPLKEKIMTDCIGAVHQYAAADADVHVNFDSRITSFRKDKKDLLPGVKNIIAVASGKGGVGKSTVSVNLALTLSASGNKVGLIDADIHGPSVPIMLGIRGKRPEVQQINGKHFIVPIEQYGIKALSIGMLVDERQAVVWRGPMVASALRQFVTNVIWGELDYLVLDLPPGTGDIHLTLVQTVPVTGAVIVTTPQDVALADARKAMGMFRMDGIKVPVVGVVENMAFFTPQELPQNKYYLFGKNGGRKLADEFEAPFLGEIPIVQNIREAGDKGMPVVLTDDVVSKTAFHNVSAEVERQIAIINANQNAGITVETVS